MEKAKHILIDTDAGTDDALAIMMIVAAHRDPSSPVQIVGIVCSHGNTSADNVASNVIRTLGTLKEEKIPVFIGAKESLVQPFVSPIPPFHGQDGFGDYFPPLNYRESPLFKEENGVLAMVRLAKEHEGTLTIVALAPFTNIAMAARLDPDFTQRVEAIYMMGGNVEGEGNTTVSGEFNFVVDPESAYITLSSFSCPMYLVPWEVTARAAISHDWRVNVLGGLATPEADLLNAAEKKILETYTDSWIACDQYAAACAIEPLAMKSTVRLHCTVELSGNFARGLMIVDKMKVLKQPENVIVIKKLDEELCKRMMIWGVSGGERPYK